jgi:hypothetical protein
VLSFDPCAGLDERGAGDRYVDNLSDFSFGHFVLSRDDDLMFALYPRQTSARQLRGSQAGQDDELKGADTRRAANHDARLDGRRCTNVNSSGIVSPHEKRFGEG